MNIETKFQLGQMVWMVQEDREGFLMTRKSTFRAKQVQLVGIRTDLMLKSADAGTATQKTEYTYVQPTTEKDTKKMAVSDTFKEMLTNYGGILKHINENKLRATKEEAEALAYQLSLGDKEEA